MLDSFFWSNDESALDSDLDLDLATIYTPRSAHFQSIRKQELKIFPSTLSPESPGGKTSQSKESKKQHIGGIKKGDSSPRSSKKEGISIVKTNGSQSPTRNREDDVFQTTITTPRRSRPPIRLKSSPGTDSDDDSVSSKSRSVSSDRFASLPSLSVPSVPASSVQSTPVPSLSLNKNQYPSARADEDGESRDSGDSDKNIDEDDYVVSPIDHEYDEETIIDIEHASTIRRYCILIIQHPLFDNISILVIIANAILLACADYHHVYAKGNLSTSHSPINRAIYNADIVFTILFTIEFLLKFTALQLHYFSSSWNIFDFLIVATAWLSLGPDIPGVKILRTLRVLRPLKSIKSYPALKEMVESVIGALGKLRSFVVIFVFFLWVFGILGLQLFSGPYMHAVCRLTPFPVNISWTPSSGVDFDAYRCTNAPNFDTQYEHPHWTKQDSPWHTPFSDCYWPIDPLDVGNLCSLNGQGSHTCIHDVDTLPVSEWRWCGSNYDALGNRRFTTVTVTSEPTYSSPLGWGYVDFDNIGSSVLLVLQTLSLTGWTNPLLYMTQSSTNYGLASIYFIVIVIFGPLFMLQLIVAMVQDSFQDEIERVIEEKASTESNDNGVGSFRFITQSQWLEFIVVVGRMVWHYFLGKLTRASEIFYQSHNVVIRLLRGIIEFCAFIISKDEYETTVQRLVLINTFILALDHYPMSNLFANSLDFVNFVLTLCFSVDLLIKLLGMGILAYFATAMNTFDAFIVVASLVELGITSTPSIVSGSAYAAVHPGGSLTSLRSLRLLRLLRMFRSRQFQHVLMKIIKSIISLESFGVLLLLYLFVMTLIGMQFFANRFRFDSNGVSIDSIGSEEWQNAADWPRHNYDDFTHAFATVFQTLTGDNWNNVLYNSLRVGGGPAGLFVMINLISGNFVVASLITAMIVNNFDNDDEDNEDEDDADLLKCLEADPDKPSQSMLSSVQRRMNAAVDKVQSLSRRKSVDPTGTDSSASTKMLDAISKFGSSRHLNVSRYLNSVLDSMEVGEASNLPDKESHEHIALDQSTSIRIRSLPSNGSSDFDRVTATLSASDEALKSIGSNLKPIKRARFKDVTNYLFCVSRVWDIFTKACQRFRVLFQSACAIVVDSPFTENFIVCIIVMSSCILPIENPLSDPHSTESNVLDHMDAVVAGIFAAEMLLKIGAVGLWEYFQHGWNILDFFVVIVSIIGLNQSDPRLSRIKGLRALRALRPLRFINRFPGLQLIIKSLIGALPELSEVALICSVVYFLFAVFFVGYLKGQLRGCSLPTVPAEVYTDDSYIEAKIDNPMFKLITHPLPWVSMSTTQQLWFGPNGTNTAASAIGSSLMCASGALWPAAPCCSSLETVDMSVSATSRIICECLGGSWQPISNKLFDNVGEAMMNLFMLSTLDNWSNSIWAIVDGSRGIDMEPIRNSNLFWVYVLILFVVMGNFLCLNFFVGVVCKEFDRMSSESSESLELTDNQRRWARTKNFLSTLKPTRVHRHPTNSWSENARAVVLDPRFELVMMAIIIVQGIVLSCLYFGADTAFLSNLAVVNTLIGWLFVGEAICKICALGSRAYFHETWNIVDFFIAVVAVISFGFSFRTISAVENTVFVISRVCRLLKLAKLAQYFPDLQKVIQIVSISGQSLLNVVSLLCLLIFIYAVVGQTLFAKIAYYKSVNESANFRSFGSTLLLLIRFSTGEGWSDFCADAAHQEPGCVEDPVYDSSYCGFNDTPGCKPLNGCGSIYIYPYLISYVLVITVIFFNLFVAIIISNYQHLKDTSCIKSSDFGNFVQAWTVVDPDGTGEIPIELIPSFVGNLFAPWGFGGKPMLTMMDAKVRKISDVGADYEISGFSAKQLNKRIGKVPVHFGKHHARSPNGVVLFTDIMLCLGASVYEREIRIFGLPSAKNHFRVQFDAIRSHKYRPQLGNSTAGKIFQRLRRMHGRHHEDSFVDSSGNHIDLGQIDMNAIYCTILIQRAYRERRLARERDTLLANPPKVTTNSDELSIETTKEGHIPQSEPSTISLNATPGLVHEQSIKVVIEDQNNLSRDPAPEIELRTDQTIPSSSFWHWVGL